MDNTTQQPLTTTQQSSQEVQQPVVPPSNLSSAPPKSKSPLFILIAFVVLVLVGGGVYLLGAKNNNQSKQAVVPTITQKSPTTVDTNKSQTDINNSVPLLPLFKSPNAVKRQLDLLGKFFYTYDYPYEVKNISDDQLLSMQCSYDLYDRENGLIYNDYVNEAYSGHFESHVLSGDQYFYNDLLKKIRLVSSGTDAFNYCKTEDGREIIEYRDNSIGKITFAFLSDKTINEITHIDTSFMSCIPVELTKQNIIYYACKGGDTKGHADIYKIQIDQKIIKHIYSCATGEPGVNPEPPSCISNPIN